MNRLILNVTPNFPYPRSPLSGIFLDRQLRQLKRLGWDAMTVHPQALLSRQALGTPKHEERESGPVFRPTYLWAGWKLPRLLPFDESWAFERALVRCVNRSVLRRGARPDIVVGNWLYPGGTGCLRVGEKLGIPVVLVARGGDVRGLAVMNASKRRSLLASLMRSDAILTNGMGLRDELGRISPDLAARATPVDFGVDTDLFSPPPAAERAAKRERMGLDPAGRTLLFAGRWEVEKGSRDILAVLDRTLPRHGWDVVIAGPVVDRQGAEELKKRYQARFLGLISQEQLREVYHAADVFLLLSHQEGQPNVVKEAMASGLAVVAYGVGGVPEIVEDGISGRVVERLAIDQAVEALRPMLDEPALAAAFGRAARTRIESTYGHTRRMASFASLLGDLVAKKGRASA